MNKVYRRNSNRAGDSVCSLQLLLDRAGGGTTIYSI